MVNSYDWSEHLKEGVEVVVEEVGPQFLLRNLVEWGAELESW